MVDSGEDPETAAFRELDEEAGVLATFTEQTPKLYTNEGANGFKFHTYLFFSPYEMKVTINEESSGFAWFSFDKLPKNLHPGFQELIEHGGWHMLSAKFGHEVEPGDLQYFSQYGNL